MRLPPAGKRLLKPLKELAATIAAMPECPRDRLVAADTPWHVLAGHPDTPVCRECYSEVVRPALARGSRVAAAFARDAAPLGPAAGATGAADVPAVFGAHAGRVGARRARGRRGAAGEGHPRAEGARGRGQAAEGRPREAAARGRGEGVPRAGGAIERQDDLELVERNLEKNEAEWRHWE